MTVSMREVVEALSGEEMDCRKAERLGAEAFPYLEELVNGEDELLASRAVWLAVRIDSQKSIGIVEIAAHRENPAIRMAAAFACSSMEGPHVERLLTELKKDQDEVVRAKATKYMFNKGQ